MKSKLLNKIKNKENNQFDNFILIIIIISSIVVGIETNHGFYISNQQLFLYFDIIVLTIFVFEILVKMSAEGKKPWRYFIDGWNIFDFIIVLLCLLPYLLPTGDEDTHAFLAFRMLRLIRAIRVLRVFRLITHFRPLQLLADALIKSIPQMMYVVVFLALIFYIYAVTGYFLFSSFDSTHFGHLSASFVTLFESISGNWSAIMDGILNSSEKIFINGKLITKSIEYPSIVPVYFISFYLLAGLVVLNLFIGIIVTEMGHVKHALRREKIKNSIEEDLIQDTQLTFIHIQRRMEQLNLLIERLKLTINNN